jgi:hypothetical protein
LIAEEILGSRLSLGGIEEYETIMNQHKEQLRKPILKEAYYKVVIESILQGGH